MTYGLAKLVLGSSAFTAISEEEYAALAVARANLRRLLIIEELLDLVIGNYSDFEIDLLSIAVRHMVSTTLDYDAMQIDRNLIANRRLLNLLSSCRSYLDHVAHHIEKIKGLDENKLISLKAFKAMTNAEYDNFLEYRVMETLRNYVQHQGFPVTVRYEGSWTDVPNEEDSRLETSFSIFLDLDDIQKGFKQSVFKELGTKEGKIDIRVMVRQYVGSIGTIHEKIREGINKGTLHWESQIEEAIHKFKVEHPDEREVGIFAVRKTEDGTYTDRIYMSRDGIEYRRKLEAKNRSLRTLARRYVTSR